MATLQGLWLLKHPNVASGRQAISNSYWRMTCTSSRASAGRRSCTAATVNHSANLVRVGDTAAETVAATAAPPTPLASVSKRNPSFPAAAANKQRQAEEDGDGDGEWLRYLEPARLEVFDQLEPWAEANVIPLLRPAEAAWQPSEMLPDAAALGADGFHTACCELRARAAGVPDAVLVCLVGNMMTEEALPTYQSMHNRFEGVRDLTGAGATAWARWIRGWSAEENRHGDVLSRYLFLSGRVDMRQVDRTIHRLISSGMVLAAARSPYHGFIYVAFQERATAISHGNTARRAGEHGDAALARICGAVAGDEKRHEAAYTRIVGKLFEVDPDGAVRALAYMMRRRITMPASLMSDGRGRDGDLFSRYAAVAQGAGVYTAADYRGIVEHLIKQWRVEELGAGLSGEGRRAQDYVCALPRKIRRLEEKAHLSSRAQKHTLSVPFSWIFDRSIVLTV